jgi:asparagine synthase (glutamine-hydrolysing)
MTVVAAYASTRSPAAAAACGMLAAMREHGGRAAAAHDAVRGDCAAAVGAARAPWQAVGGLGGPTLVAERGGVCVAADAALYYRGELRRALADAGVALAGAADDPAELIAAAYLAWGPECAARLEGDFAFVLWDAGRRRVMAARDFAGRRPLYYAEFAGALAVASSPRGVLAAPGCPRGLDLRALAATAAGFLGATDQTVHAAVRALPAGHTLVADLRGAAWVTPHWEPPLFESAAPRARADFDEAAGGASGAAGARGARAAGAGARHGDVAERRVGTRRRSSPPAAPRSRRVATRASSARCR